MFVIPVIYRAFFSTEHVFRDGLIYAYVIISEYGTFKSR